MKDGIIRSIFTLGLIAMVYRETGFFTALCLLLIAANNEIIAYALRGKENKKST